MCRLAEVTVPGRWEYCRQPTDAELQTTGILRMRVESGSAKIRTGPPNDTAADIKAHAGSIWTGVVPLQLIAGHPISGPYNAVHSPPEHIQALATLQR